MQPVPKIDRLAVSVKEAAVMLSVSERSIWRLAEQGELKRLMVGSRVLFPIASLQSFIDRGSAEKPEGRFDIAPDDPYFWGEESKSNGQQTPSV